VTVPWLKLFVASLSQRSPGFTPGSDHMNLYWTKWCWERFISEFFWFSLVDIIPPCLHTHVLTGDWKIGQFEAAVQRHNPRFTPSTWTSQWQRATQKGICTIINKKLFKHWWVASCLEIFSDTVQDWRTYGPNWYARFSLHVAFTAVPISSLANLVILWSIYMCIYIYIYIYICIYTKA
jgi:hypothetical protein